MHSFRRRGPPSTVWRPTLLDETCVDVENAYGFFDAEPSLADLQEPDGDDVMVPEPDPSATC